MPKKISIIRKREWLQHYEEGQPEAAIARDAHCDTRTVKAGIEEARRERVASLARGDLVKEALRGHHGSLLGVIEEVLSALRLPPSTQQIPWKGIFSPASMRIEGGTAQYDNLVGPRVTGISLDVEDKTEWGLLQEHLKKDPFWKALGRWKEAMASHLEARIIMKLKLAGLLREKTGCEFVEEPASGPSLYSSAVDVLFQQIIQQSLKLVATSKFEDNIIIDPDRGEIRYSRASILAHAPGTEEECKECILDAVSTVRASEEAENVISTYRMVEELTAKARQAADEIRMMGLIPGQCHICRRLGV